MTNAPKDDARPEIVVPDDLNMVSWDDKIEPLNAPEDIQEHQRKLDKKHARRLIDANPDYCASLEAVRDAVLKSEALIAIAHAHSLPDIAIRAIKDIDDSKVQNLISKGYSWLTIQSILVKELQDILDSVERGE